MLVKDAVASATHTALEDELFFLVGVETRPGATVNRAGRRAAANVFGIAAYSSGDSTDSGTESGTFGDPFGDGYFVRISLTFVPVADELLLVNAFHIDNRIGVCCAARQDSSQSSKKQKVCCAHDVSR